MQKQEVQCKTITLYDTDYNDYYVSEDGRVFSWKGKKVKELKLQKIGGHPGSKYLAVRISDKNIKRIEYVHRLVAKALIPNPDNKREVNHIDGCKLNNHVSNLEWATPKENVQHRVRYLKTNLKS